MYELLINHYKQQKHESTMPRAGNLGYIGHNTAIYLNVVSSRMLSCTLLGDIDNLKYIAS